jgi:hypothetical protein
MVCTVENSSDEAAITRAGRYEVHRLPIEIILGSPLIGVMTDLIQEAIESAVRFIHTEP